MSRALTDQELTDQVARLSAQSAQTTELLHQVNAGVLELVRIVSDMQAQIRDLQGRLGGGEQ